MVKSVTTLTLGLLSSQVRTILVLHRVVSLEMTLCFQYPSTSSYMAAPQRGVMSWNRTDGAALKEKEGEPVPPVEY